MTLWQEHKVKWQDCKRCQLYKGRSRVVLARGHIPCEALLIGEAPGASENALGKPFVGPAGHLLDKILAHAWSDKVRYALTNLVACFPREAKRAGNPEPPRECIEACAPRLASFARLCQPELVVAVGTLADKYTAGMKNKVTIMHPAAILRMDMSQRGLAIQRCVVTLSDAIVPF
jgi:DNA polymerase